MFSSPRSINPSLRRFLQPPSENKWRTLQGDIHLRTYYNPLRYAPPPPLRSVALKLGRRPAGHPGQAGVLKCELYAIDWA